MVIAYTLYWYGFFLETSKIHIFIELEAARIKVEESPADTQESIVLRRCRRKQLQTMRRVSIFNSHLSSILITPINFQIAQPMVKISIIWTFREVNAWWLGLAFCSLRIFPITQFSSLRVCVMMNQSPPSGTTVQI